MSHPHSLQLLWMVSSLLLIPLCSYFKKVWFLIIKTMPSAVACQQMPVMFLKLLKWTSGNCAKKRENLKHKYICPWKNYNHNSISICATLLATLLEEVHIRWFTFTNVKQRLCFSPHFWWSPLGRIWCRHRWQHNRVRTSLPVNYFYDTFLNSTLASW